MVWLFLPFVKHEQVLGISGKESQVLSQMAKMMQPDPAGSHITLRHLRPKSSVTYWLILEVWMAHRGTFYWAQHAFAVVSYPAGNEGRVWDRCVAGMLRDCWSNSSNSSWLPWCTQCCKGQREIHWWRAAKWNQGPSGDAYPDQGRIGMAES